MIIRSALKVFNDQGELLCKSSKLQTWTSIEKEGNVVLHRNQLSLIKEIK